MKILSFCNTKFLYDVVVYSPENYICYNIMEHLFEHYSSGTVAITTEY